MPSTRVNFEAADAADADDFPSVSFTDISFNGLRCESCSTKLSILVSIPAIIFVSVTYGGVGSDAAGAAGATGDDAAAGGNDGSGRAGDSDGVCAGAALGFFCITSSSSNPCLKRSYVLQSGIGKITFLNKSLSFISPSTVE